MVVGVAVGANGFSVSHQQRRQGAAAATLEYGQGSREGAGLGQQGQELVVVSQACTIAIPALRRQGEAEGSRVQGQPRLSSKISLQEGKA